MPIGSSRVTPFGSARQDSTSSSVIVDQPRTTSRVSGVSGRISPSASSRKIRSGEHRPRLVVDVAQRLVAARGRLDQRQVALVVGEHVVEVRRHRDEQPLLRLAVDGRRGLRDQVVGRAAYDGLAERVLAAEVVVEQAARDPGLLGQDVDAQLLDRARSPAAGRRGRAAGPRRSSGLSRGARGLGHARHPIY